MISSSDFCVYLVIIIKFITVTYEWSIILVLSIHKIPRILYYGILKIPKNFTGLPGFSKYFTRIPRNFKKC